MGPLQVKEADSVAVQVRIRFDSLAKPVGLLGETPTSMAVTMDRLSA